MKNRKLLASLLLFIATVVWGLSYSIQSISAENLGPFTVVFFKGIGGVFLLPLILKGKHVIDKGTILCGMAIGAVAFAGCSFQQLGIISSTVSKAGFITSLYIIFVPILEKVSGKKISTGIIVSVFIALLGLYFLCFSTGESFGIGDLYLLLCSLCFAVQIIMIDSYTRKHDALSITFVSQTTIAVLAGILMITKERPGINDISQALLPILYIVFISGMIAQSIQVVYQKDAGASLASLIMSLEAVFSTIFGWLLLNQTLTPKELLGCFLVFSAIIVAERHG